MKKRVIRVVFICCILFNCKMLYAQVGMMTNNPDKSAVLDMKAVNNKGLLIPNVSLVGLNNPAPIVNNAPETGLMVYNTNATLPALNGQPGGMGFYYWDGAKWCHMLIASNIGAADNLGSHIAANSLTMSDYNINSVNKLSTQTESIAQGTDAVLPQINNIATSNDASGNVVWRTPKGIAAADNFSFYKTSTSAVITSYQTWKDIPGLSNFTYTAPASGTLVIQGIIYSRGNPTGTTLSAGEFWQPSTADVRLQVYNGTTLIDQNISWAAVKMFGPAISGFPDRSVILLQVPVTAGITYTFKTMCNRSGYYSAMLPAQTLPEIQFGSITLDGAVAATSYINAFLVKLN